MRTVPPLPNQLSASPARNESYLFEAGAYRISKKADHDCEDSFFISKKGIGLSDGVGSWNKYGISAGKFAEDLMIQCKKLIEGDFESKVISSGSNLKVP